MRMSSRSWDHENRRIRPGEATKTAEDFDRTGFDVLPALILSPAVAESPMRWNDKGGTNSVASGCGIGEPVLFLTAGEDFLTSPAAVRRLPKMIGANFCNSATTGCGIPDPN